MIEPDAVSVASGDADKLSEEKELKLSEDEASPDDVGRRVIEAQPDADRLVVALAEKVSQKDAAAEKDCDDEAIELSE